VQHEREIDLTANEDRTYDIQVGKFVPRLPKKYEMFKEEMDSL
jgi:hypothetical protein